METVISLIDAVWHGQTPQGFDLWDYLSRLAQVVDWRSAWLSTDQLIKALQMLGPRDTMAPPPAGPAWPMVSPPELGRPRWPFIQNTGALEMIIPAPLYYRKTGDTLHLVPAPVGASTHPMAIMLPGRWSTTQHSIPNGTSSSSQSGQDSSSQEDCEADDEADDEEDE